MSPKRDLGRRNVDHHCLFSLNAGSAPTLEGGTSRRPHFVDSIRSAAGLSMKQGAARRNKPRTTGDSHLARAMPTSEPQHHTELTLHGP